MSDWTAGYVADIDYTYGYYTELNPQRIKLAFLSAGLAAPEVGHACELGFGQGISVNMHAAASSVQWHGTDFNPGQAAFARELAAICDAKAELTDEAFDVFTLRKDLPEFDFIGLHGIWSWISDENRALIVDFLRRKLKVGGVLYISYNTLPGWATFAPVRHLLTEFDSKAGNSGKGMADRVNDSVNFTEQLLKVQPAFAKANPQIVERVEKLKNQDRHYLAHEYFNQDWLPMHFGTIAKWLDNAKLSYACSARFTDHVDAINLSADQQAFLAEIPSNTFRESVRDFIVNNQFRADYWVKGARKLNNFDRDEALRKVRVLLLVEPKNVPLKIKGNQGEVTLLKDVYRPILNLLADHKIKALGDIEAALQKKNLKTTPNFIQISQALLILVGAGHLALAQDDAMIKAASIKTEKLNNSLMNKARGSNDIQCLVSPVTGGGVSVSRFNQLFLLAIKQGDKAPEDWAAFTWQVLVGRGLKVINEGKMIETDAENLAHLKKLAQAFEKENLPVIRALGVV